ncbi:MAG TPA: hypothetical protein VM864_10585 [Pyrinomonadaceae bacterium]|jgi:hypothetical protein|nr:hypothetical protein [Pyrinomonadaceae bacterium]
MRRQLLSLISAALVLACAAGAARADIRIKQRMTFGGQAGGEGRAMESDVAIKGQRQRSEQELAPGMKMVSITQCDMKRMLNISDSTRKYTVTPLGGAEEPAPGARATPTPAAPAARPTRGGVVTYVMTMTDTGERKQMFGYTARHIITKTRTEHSPDACDQNDMAYEADGWYIDLEFNFECLTGQRPASSPMAQQSGGCQDTMRFRRVGTAKMGYPVLVTTRFFGKDGKVQSEMTQEVVSLTRATLDAALFDVPAGYTETQNPQELYDMAGMMQSMQRANRDRDDESGGGRTQSSARDRGGMNTPAAMGAKRPGVVRVGVVRVGNKTTQSLDAGNLRGTLIAAISEGSVEAIPLDESVPDAAQAEAKQKECDYVLFTDVSGLKQSAANKIGGLLGRATGASSGAERYEAKLDYTLVPVAGGAPTQAAASAKEEGGADVSLSSALRKEAQAVLAKVRK